MSVSDEHLLELALQGDGDCFGQLVERWEGKIYGFIYRYVRNREEARDLTQDTFTKAFQNLDRLSDPARFSSWLYTIALNECRMRFRRQNPAYRISSLDESRNDIEQLDRHEVTPERTYEGREKIRQMIEAFGHLPDEQRVVILMKEYQGLKFHEIADALDIPVSTAKSRLYLGLRTLKRLMEKAI
ncbi:MAG TPA: sigma-70 family RNA polymerase sigma factor [Acidobacteriota bacterium]|nr:sigma-70 family RNA polymerase sigma factor [Acidobacteriota bacterium]